MGTIPRRWIPLASMALVALCVAAPAGADPPAGIIAWWPADGNAEDTVGGNDGTLQGGASFASGRIGQAFDLSGPADYVIASHYSFGGGDDFTIALWTRLDQTPTQQAFAIETRKDQVFGWAVTVWTDDRYLLGGRCDNISPAFSKFSNAATTPGEWHHVAVAFDWQADEARIHVDGCLDAISDLSACDGFTGSDKFFLGVVSSLDPQHHFPGRLDEVQLYGRALATGEIRSVFESAGAPAPCADPDAVVPALGAGWIGLLVGVLAVLGGRLAFDRRRRVAV